MKQQIDNKNGSEQQEAARSEAIVKSAGRGTIYITIAKLYFIVSGYAIYFFLPRILSAQEFGQYGFVTGVVSIINAVIVIGTQQAVSKFVSEDTRRADAVRRLALKLQLFIGGGITLGYFLAAPIIARTVNDLSLITPLRISAAITISYTFYSVYIGYLNGQRKFLQQSILDMTYSTLKAASIVLLALYVRNVDGAIAGFGLSAILVLLLSPIISGQAKDQVDVKPAAADFIKFQFALLGFTLVNNLLQKIDMLMLKGLGSVSNQEASEMVGYYTAAMAIANITYQAIISITFVIFPLISTATVEARSEEVKSYIQETVKYTLMIMALSATIFSSNAALILRILYKEGYEKGAGALTIVAYGMLFFGLIYILTTIVSSSGRPRVSLVIGILVLSTSAVLNYLLIPRYGLMGAASGTTIAMGIGAMIAAGYIFRTFGAFARIKTLGTISFAAVICYQIAVIYNKFPIFKDRFLSLFVILAAQGLVYLMVLLLSGEIGKKEIQMIRKIVSI